MTFWISIQQNIIHNTNPTLAFIHVKKIPKNIDNNLDRQEEKVEKKNARHSFYTENYAQLTGKSSN